MKSAFVCESCRNVVAFAQDRFTKRIEIRLRGGKQTRLRTKKVADLCRSCAKEDAAVLKADRPSNLAAMPCLVCLTRTEGFDEAEKRWEYQRANKQDAQDRFVVGVLHVECVPRAMGDEEGIRGEQMGMEL